MVCAARRQSSHTALFAHRSSRLPAAPSAHAVMTAWRLAALYAAAAAFASAVSLPGGDPDTYWHLASGKWMVEHGQLLRADVFSSTATGAPYSVGEWLGELALYGAYVVGGWAGLALLKAMLVAVGAFF